MIERFNNGSSVKYIIVRYKSHYLSKKNHFVSLYWYGGDQKV